MERKDDRERDPGLQVDLLAYADDMLPPGRVAEVEAALARDPEARDAVAAWRQQARIIREAAARADALPVNLQTAQLERQLTRRLRRSRLRAALVGPQMRSAAAAVLVFAAGWGTHALTAPGSDPLAGHPDYVARALGGHLLYADDAYEARRFAAAELPIALRFISEQFGHDLRLAAFDLPEYRIETVRYMQNEQGPVALFSYRDSRGGPATLAIQPHSPGEPVYSLSVDLGVYGSIASWSDDAVDYTIIAAVDDKEILPVLASFGALEPR